jgi:pimeloyl-ACP methyl ester carboxylesterase
MRGYPPTSLAPDGDYSAQALGADALALIAALGESQAVVLGHDWGAFAAYSAANQQPDRVEKLIVLSIPHPSTLRTNLRQLSKSSHFMTFQWRARTVRRFQDPDEVRRLYRQWSPGWDVGDEELAPVQAVFAAPGGVEGALGYYWSFARDLTRPARKGVRDMLRRITTMPTLALYGDQDGALDPSTFAVSHSAFSGPYEVVCLPGVGHFVHREAAPLVHDHVLRFLGRAFTCW